MCMVGVIAMHVGRSLPWQMLMPMILWHMLLPWQILLPIFHVLYLFMADVIAKDCVFILLFIIGRCYCLIFVVDVEITLAYVICQVADVIATIGWCVW